MRNWLSKNLSRVRGGGGENTYYDKKAERCLCQCLAQTQKYRHIGNLQVYSTVAIFNAQSTKVLK